MFQKIHLQTSARRCSSSCELTNVILKGKPCVFSKATEKVEKEEFSEVCKEDFERNTNSNSNPCRRKTGHTPKMTFAKQQKFQYSKIKLHEVLYVEPNDIYKSKSFSVPFDSEKTYHYANQERDSNEDSELRGTFEVESCVPSIQYEPQGLNKGDNKDNSTVNELPLENGLTVPESKTEGNIRAALQSDSSSANGAENHPEDLQTENEEFIRVTCQRQSKGSNPQSPVPEESSTNCEINAQAEEHGILNTELEQPQPCVPDFTNANKDTNTQEQFTETKRRSRHVRKSQYSNYSSVKCSVVRICASCNELIPVNTHAWNNPACQGDTPTILNSLYPVVEEDPQALNEMKPMGLENGLGDSQNPQQLVRGYPTVNYGDSLDQTQMTPLRRPSINYKSDIERSRRRNPDTRPSSRMCLPPKKATIFFNDKPITTSHNNRYNFSQVGNFNLFKSYPNIEDSFDLSQNHSLYDDSHFPTAHRLATSPELRRAMNRVRKSTSEYQAVTRNFDANAVYFDDNVELQHQSNMFLNSLDINRQLKFRNIVSKLKRSSDKFWSKGNTKKASALKNQNSEGDLIDQHDSKDFALTPYSGYLQSGQVVLGPEMYPESMQSFNTFGPEQKPEEKLYPICESCARAANWVRSGGFQMMTPEESDMFHPRASMPRAANNRQRWDTNTREIPDRRVVKATSLGNMNFNKRSDRVTEAAMKNNVYTQGTRREPQYGMLTNSRSWIPRNAKGQTYLSCR